MRIGEVAQATGIAPATLRAWERRHAILSPTRTAGGHRVYGAGDVARVRAVAALIDSGMGVSVAARRLIAPGDDRSTVATSMTDHVWAALDHFDELTARAAVREASDVLGVPDAFDLVFVPVLRRLGSEWRLTPRNIAREHFASSILRAHLVELLPAGQGAPTCLAFCPEGERHDHGLMMATATLGRAGWHAIVLGADTPLASVEILIKELEPALVLIGAIGRRPITRLLDRWTPPRRTPLIAGGSGFRATDARRLGGHMFSGIYAALPGVAADAMQRSTTL